MEFQFIQRVGNGLTRREGTQGTKRQIIDEAVQYTREHGRIELFVGNGIRFMIEPNSDPQSIVKEWSDQVRPQRTDIS